MERERWHAMVGVDEERMNDMQSQCNIAVQHATFKKVKRIKRERCHAMISGNRKSMNDMREREQREKRERERSCMNDMRSRCQQRF